VPITIATSTLWPGIERPSVRVSTTRSNSAPTTKTAAAPNRKMRR
jgi:hypothetical protein